MERFALSPAWGIWAITAAATAGVILRPLAWPESIWALVGAALLVGLGWLSPREALSGLANGTDVYLFLIGMMLLAELARAEGLFAWLAAQATRLAAGSATRLFTLIFAVGIVVTIFLSNDATAVVLTPAVPAVVEAAAVAHPLPYLFTCAFIANAASFVLPISNPANLVIYGRQMPPLFQWIPRYALASVFSISATYVVLRLTQRRALRQPVSADLRPPALTPGGKLTAGAIVSTAVILMTASAYGMPLGLPTLVAGVITTLAVPRRSYLDLIALLRAISWNVLLLVAGLFVMVDALEATGILTHLSALLDSLLRHSPMRAPWVAGLNLALGCNLVNNLPAGLLAGRVAALAHAPDSMRAALLIGVDLGPNLSVTGSLATILWLASLRRDGQTVGAWDFVKLGVLVMPPALLLAIAGALLYQ